MQFKKIIGLVHLWLGLPSGLVVFILGATGCIFCFQTELKNLFYSERYFVSERNNAAFPISQLKANAQSALGNEYPITFLQYSPNSNTTYRFRASKLNADALTYRGEVLYNKTVFVNPYTGKVQYIENTKWEFFNLVLQLHYDLLLNKIGHQIVGYSALVFVVMLLTGIVLWWPKHKAALKQRLLFKWKHTTRWKRKNYDLHNIPGFYSLIIALFISLTGIWFAFDWFRHSVEWVASGGKPLMEKQKVYSDTTKIKMSTNIDMIEQSIRMKSLQAGSYFMSFPEAKTAPIVVTALHNKDNFAKRSQYFFDKNTGEELKSNLYHMQSGAKKMNFMIYDIHVGKILGLPGQLIAFLGSLIAASLPVTGFIIWWGRRKKNKIGYKKISQNKKLSIRGKDLHINAESVNMYQ